MQSGGRASRHAPGRCFKEHGSLSDDHNRKRLERSEKKKASQEKIVSPELRLIRSSEGV
jgi:hypothetical protein